MSIHFKGKEFTEQADKLTRELFDENGNLREQPLTTEAQKPQETPDETPETTPETPQVETTVEAEVKPEEKKVEAKQDQPDPDKKYKDAVKAMNEAQRKAADAEKLIAEQAKRTAELEARVKELAEAQKKQVYVPEDDLENDLPDVAKISERKAEKVKQELDPRLQSIEERFAKLEEAAKKEREAQASLLMRQEITQAHPDFDEVVNSDEMVAWINNEAPPIYKAIYDGTVPASARDIVEVVNRYKSTLAAPKVTADTPSDKATPAKTAVQPSTKPAKLAPISEAELIEFKNRGHKWPQEKRAEFNARLEAMLK